MTTTVLILATIGLATVIFSIMWTIVWAIEVGCKVLAKDSDVDPMNYIVGAVAAAATVIIVGFAILGVYQGSDRIYFALYGTMPT